MMLAHCLAFFAQTQPSFDRTMELIKPTPAESAWSSIPWMIDMNTARKKAAQEGKPLVIWTNGGEPLGAT